MTDKERWQFTQGIIQQAIYLRESLPHSTQQNCACDNTGHCGHHANVDGRLADAIKAMQLVASAIRYPNGTGDRPAF